MPTYEYKCPSCDIVYTEIRSMLEQQKRTQCEKCPSLLIRDYKISGVGFNGSGFYTTDKKQ